jgi:hypothetical protein
MSLLLIDMHAMIDGAGASSPDDSVRSSSRKRVVVDRAGIGCDSLPCFVAGRCHPARPPLAARAQM